MKVVLGFYYYDHAHTHKAHKHTHLSGSIAIGGPSIKGMPLYPKSNRIRCMLP